MRRKLPGCLNRYMEGSHTLTRNIALGWYRRNLLGLFSATTEMALVAPMFLTSAPKHGTSLQGSPIANLGCATLATELWLAFSHFSFDALISKCTYQKPICISRNSSNDVWRLADEWYRQQIWYLPNLTPCAISNCKSPLRFTNTVFQRPRDMEWIGEWPRLLGSS